MIAMDSITRHVGDLDAAARFYCALGFKPGKARPWAAADLEAALWDAEGLEWRGLTLTLPSAVSDREFPLHLREFRGMPRRAWHELDAWSVGTGHIGLGVEDPNRTWDALAAAGELRAQTRGGARCPCPTSSVRRVSAMSSGHSRLSGTRMESSLKSNLPGRHTQRRRIGSRWPTSAPASATST
jgi:catechol 2,3-dioxygenase-like lactoylglutathione lyase family enzyme